jgi:hypothetical protein
MFEAIVNGCLPVVIADGLQLPFEQHVPYTKFSLFLREEDAQTAHQVLEAVDRVPDSEIQNRQHAMSKYAPLFLSHIAMAPSEYTAGAADMVLVDLCDSLQVHKNTATAKHELR